MNRYVIDCLFSEVISGETSKEQAVDHICNWITRNKNTKLVEDFQNYDSLNNLYEKGMIDSRDNFGKELNMLKDHLKNWL